MIAPVDLFLSEPALPAPVTDTAFHEFYEYWHRRVTPGRLPGRQHIDPLDIPQLLPGIGLFDVLRGGDRYRFRFRLMGSTFVDAMGADNTGRFVDEVVLLAVKYEALYRTFQTIVDRRQPHYWETPVTMPGREFIALKRLALPLASDGETVDMIIGYYVPVYGSAGRYPAF